jgi:pimeloyl-ACP methyl ester carboxylesterase
MSAFHQVGPLPSAAPAGVPAQSESRLWVGETLASSRRLWLRGRILDLAPVTPATSWYNRWRGKTAAPELPRTAHLETRVSAIVLEADVPISPDGRFEALVPAQLPPSRRGWRLARNRLTYGSTPFEACALVLTPTPEAKAALVVVLPLAYTFADNGPSEFARSEHARRLTPLLSALRQEGRASSPVYYLAAVSSEDRQRELALATTALGWPAGHFVLAPTFRNEAAQALSTGLDRLRWLFAGSLDLEVFNLEPGLAPLTAEHLQPAEDRARVVLLINPEDDLASALARRACAPRAAPGAQRPLRARRLTRYPLVFCHGMLAFCTLRMQLPDNLNPFAVLGQSLRERGFQALFPQVAPTSGIVARARQLGEQIRRWTDRPVNLIAHSMGGMDARYLITHLGIAERVRSLTTIATPHRGTYLADWFVTNYRNRVPLLLAMQAMGVNVDGFRDCRLNECAAFNHATPDMPGVAYFSYGGAVVQARVTPFLRRAWAILTPVEGPNDGMVSLASARWGEYLGNIAADHFAQTPDAVFVRPGEDFDAAGFYYKVIDELARRGL